MSEVNDGNFNHISFSGKKIIGWTYKNCKFSQCVFKNGFYENNKFENCLISGCDFRSHSIFEEKVKKMSAYKEKSLQISALGMFPNMSELSSKKKLDICESVGKINEEFEVFELIRERNQQMLGRVFEFFAKDILNRKFRDSYDFYLYQETSEAYKRKMGLNINDFGVDIVGIPKSIEAKHILVQVKYRGLGMLSTTDLGTYFLQLFDREEFVGIIFTSAVYFHTELLRFFGSNKISFVSYNEIIEFISDNGYDFSDMIDRFIAEDKSPSQEQSTYTYEKAPEKYDGFDHVGENI